MNISADYWVRHLPELECQLLDPFVDTTTLRDLDELGRRRARMEILPYSISATAAAVRDFIEAQHAVAMTHRPVLEKERAIQTLSDDERNSLGFQVDHFLDAARRAQNAIIPYLSYAFKRSLPNSLKDLVSGLASNRYQLPDEITGAVNDYWARYGLQLKHYRDLAQHFVVLASEGRVFLSEKGDVGIFLLLPSDPECAGAAKLKYVPPLVHAYPWLLDQFVQLVAFVNYVTFMLLDPEKPMQRLFVMGIKPRIGGGGIGTEGIIIQEPAAIVQALDETVEGIRVHYPMPKPKEFVETPNKSGRADG